MTIWLKQSTAVTVKIGPFLDDTDGKTAETGLTISQADVRLSKNGGDIVQKNNSTACTHDELGYYDCPLSATDTNTLGALRLMVHESGALPVWHDFMVVPAAVYDSLIGGSDTLPADVTHISGDAAAADALEAILDGTRAALYLTQLSVVATGNNSAIVATGSGTGHGIAATGGNSSGAGLRALGGTNGHGLEAIAGGFTPATGATLHGLYAEGGGEGAGIRAEGGGEGGGGMELLGALAPGLYAIGDGTSPGIAAQNGGTTPAITDNDAGMAVLIWDAQTADHDVTGSFGEVLGAGSGSGGTDIQSVDGSTTAAENLRKWFDGTGYAATASSVGGVASEVTANVTKLNGSATNAARLGLLANGVVSGVAVAGTLTTTAMTTSLTETTDNHWKPPHVVKWTSGNLAGQARAVTGYVGATKMLQYEATTEAPAAGDGFVIL